MRVVGLDLSLTSTGLVCADDHVEVIKPKTRGPERLDCIRREVLEHLGGTDLVMLEGYSFNSQNSHSHALGELGGLIRWTLYRNGIDYGVMSPSSLKQFATGKGNATKDQMLTAAIRAAKGLEIDDNNAADAWLLREAGYHAVDPSKATLSLTDYRSTALSRIEWSTPERTAA